MMELIRQWIVGITCAAVIGALAEGLVPRGGGRKALRLAVGLLLMLAVLRPLAEADPDVLAEGLTHWRLRAEGYGEILDTKDAALIKTIIEERTCAYISDKARELGISCTAEVVYHYGEDGAVWPTEAVLRGSFTLSQKESLARVLEAELAIPAENLTFEGVSEG